MFKNPDSKSPINDKHFGLGSYMVDCTGDIYLVVPTYNDNMVALLYLPSMTVFTSTYVKDVNHLTEEEARELLSLTRSNNAFSDMSLNATGIKKYKGVYT